MKALSWKRPHCNDKQLKDTSAHKAFELYHWQCFTDLFPICSYAEQTFWAVQQQFGAVSCSLRLTVYKCAGVLCHELSGADLFRSLPHKTARQDSPKVTFLIFAKYTTPWKQKKKTLKRSKESMCFKSIPGSQACHLLIGNPWASYVIPGSGHPLYNTVGRVPGL